jgi:hypothetical protein
MRGFALAAALLLLASLPLLVVDIPAAAVPALMAVMIAAAITAGCLVAVAIWLSRLPPQQGEVLV